MAGPYDLYVFDAYGTLFDVGSAVARHRAEVGPHADRMADIWRLKQLEYTWVRSLMGAYRDFRQVTADALDYAAARCAGLSEETREKLLAAYERLDAYPDVRPALAALRARGARIAILSNGTPAMLEAAVDAAGLASSIEACLSVDALRVFKTAPAVYAMVEQALGVPPARVSFQSSNRWDVAGAAKFGFRAVWVNRIGMPEEYWDLPPALVVSQLRGLDAL
jgi:2-haloacid dehalogenase